MQSVQSLLRNYFKDNTSERLGQYFVNRYIDGVWPHLFYEQSDVQSTVLIMQWLEDNGYTDSLPEET